MIFSNTMKYGMFLWTFCTIAYAARGSDSSDAGKGDLPDTEVRPSSRRKTSDDKSQEQYMYHFYGSRDGDYETLLMPLLMMDPRPEIPRPKPVSTSASRQALRTRRDVIKNYLKEILKGMKSKYDGGTTESLVNTIKEFIDSFHHGGRISNGHGEAINMIHDTLVLSKSKFKSIKNLMEAVKEVVLMSFQLREIQEYLNEMGEPPQDTANKIADFVRKRGHFTKPEAVALIHGNMRIFTTDLGLTRSVTVRCFIVLADAFIAAANSKD